MRLRLGTLFLTMLTRRTSFLTMSTRRAWPGWVKWIRAGGKESLSRREALDDLWTREGFAHVFFKRRILVAIFDFLGWVVLVDEEVGHEATVWPESVRTRRDGSVLTKFESA